ncbi:MAG: DUF4153 domain-containing protein [Treponema sp.]|nr:DUF4153 domain-containing protein [Treponema sp.]
MNVFANLWRTIKPTVRRFPAFFMLSALVAVFTSVYWVQDYGGHGKAELLGIIKACVWAGILSLVLQMTTEYLVIQAVKTGRSYPVKSRLLRMLDQIACVVLPLALGAFVCKSDSERFYLVYFGTLFALLMAAGVLLHTFQRKSVVIPNIIIAGMIAGIICGCISSGGSIIALAVQNLIYDFSNYEKYVYPIIFIVAGTFFFPCVFISYVTKRDEEITIPRAFMLIFQFVLFPLYVVLLCVLYAYLAKCLFLRSMPRGMINPFVSFATVCYLLFYLTLQESRVRVMAVFYRWGAAAMFPLIVIQCIAFAVRVHAYGMTGSRQASLFYILFSIAFCVLALYKRGKHMTSVYPLFAVMCLFASLTPFNLIDAPARSQYARLKTVAARYALLDTGRLQPAADSGEAIPASDKQRMVSAYDAVRNSEAKRPDWFTSAAAFPEDGKLTTDSFAALFGFEYGEYDEEERKTYTGFKVVMDSNAPLDISAWKELRAVSESNYDESVLTVSFDAGDVTFDITEELRAKLHQSAQSSMYQLSVDAAEPLVLHKDGYALVLTYACVFCVTSADGKENWDWRIQGYLCR